MRYLFTFFFALIFLNAKTINYVVATVDDEPITFYDVQQTSQVLNISAKNALQLLSQTLLQNKIAAQFNIMPNTQALDDFYKQLSLKTNINAFTLKRNTAIVAIAQNRVVKKQLFDAIFVKEFTRPRDEALRAFYTQNPSLFTNIIYDITQYGSASKTALQKFVQNPLLQNKSIFKKNITLEHLKIIPAFQKLFSQTKTGEFSSIIRVPSGFASFFMNKKTISYTGDFASLKQLIMQRFVEQNREKIVESFLIQQKRLKPLKIVRPLG